MGRRHHVPRRQLSEDADFPQEVKGNAKDRAEAEFMPPELDEEGDENSHDGSLTIGDGCFLTQHPTGYGPDL